MRYYNNFLNIF
jgi:hypothetical protein